MKKAIALLSATVLLVVLAGCGSSVNTWATIRDAESGMSVSLGQDAKTVDKELKDEGSYDSTYGTYYYAESGFELGFDEDRVIYVETPAYEDRYTVPGYTAGTARADLGSDWEEYTYDAYPEVYFYSCYYDKDNNLVAEDDALYEVTLVFDGDEFFFLLMELYELS